jgi:hypothetical protein
LPVSYNLHAMASFLAIAEPALIGAGIIALPIGANALLSYLRIQKLLPVVRRAFVVLDPLLNEHISGYGGSDVRFAMELVTGVLADGALTREEIQAAVNEIERRYRPSKAAGRTSEQLALTLGPDSPEVKLLDAAVSFANHRELLPSNLLDAVKFVRTKIS